ncbi:hypothetical protein J2792_000393 [Novosphingobium capsulatum]|uniref:Glycine zipper domain-containing protein n=1 Tax=Novosphingobium capsulatum TaxID=13688 RepID=A0ABU1MGT9_9SPHN|nr:MULTISPECIES: glycine zipper domain-containing protein [Novosphingobium]KPF55383.1 hypothetical protein IP65_04460 [Novosphingobium sp. AAP1]MBB3358409.1 hypothetical protein [Novosphingobium sp. BK256]MBB3374770.1 hypothetical protein [Novosphingobium sp. BK280]MBB3379541.1 hypothetical protein [Novosphingobium sp. BK258]MBB3421236.1 hypothetical protein [Novosphingobium sp. BK267]
MGKKFLIPAAIALGALSLGGCARNYAGEGGLAGAGVGAAVAGISGGNIGTGAAIGGAVGAAAGSQVKKDCWRTDADGRSYRVC